MSINQGAPSFKSISGKLNSQNELPCEGQTSGDKLQQSEYANKKGTFLESDVQESGSSEKIGWKKNGSSIESATSTSEKEIVMTKTRTQTVKSRQTHSGPLMPGAVLTHSASDRGRISERFIMDVSFVLWLSCVCIDVQ